MGKIRYYMTTAVSSWCDMPNPKNSNFDKAQRRMVKSVGKSAAFLISLLLCAASPWQSAFAAGYNVLQECMKLTGANDEIHDCIDNYLDIMDDNIRDISDYISRDLSDAALDRFQLSQQAFIDYREKNCLWYLEFSAPRETAEQVAKNCLANMSQIRLSELQSLIATDKGKANTLRGFYVYGANRNSFQPCGSEQRYWVEGENAMVGQLQQDYLSKSTASLQVLYAELVGSIDASTSYPEHSGIVKVTGISALKVPSDSECSLPRGSSANTLASRAEIKPAVVSKPKEVIAQAEETQQPEQAIKAYFGDWLVECTQSKTRHTCDLVVGFSGDGVTEKNKPELRMSRRAKKRTLLYMAFPDREIDSPTKIRWSVDKYTFGDIVGSDIRVDDAGTRQLIHERKFVRDDLMPLLRDGSEVSVSVVNDVDDTKGNSYAASLKGLTRALVFADDFVASGGKL